MYIISIEIRSIEPQQVCAGNYSGTTDTKCLCHFNDDDDDDDHDVLMSRQVQLVGLVTSLGP